MAAYGLQIPDFGWITEVPGESLARLRSVAEAAEAAGFSSLWVMDHLFQLDPLGGRTQPMFEAYTLLGALAAVTTRVKLGALITGVTYRNPAILAKQVTTLDVLSGGRAILGIGAAWHDSEHEAFNVEFPPVRQRYEQLIDAVHICRLMFGPDAEPSYAGTHHSITRANNVPKPIQGEHLEIMIGGSGEKKTLRYVAQLADACNVSGGLVDVRRRMALIDGYCAEAGRDPREVRRTRLGSLFLSKDEAEADATRAFLDSLAPVVPGVEKVDAGWVVGTAPQIIEQVRGYLETGLDEVIFNVPFVRSPDQIIEVGALLAQACASSARRPAASAG